ncbi:hypothetical protein RPF67_21820, partial [Escherichia coli]|nr:hypothetical protein [Escherichia coli]
TSKTPSYTKSVSWHHYPQGENKYGKDTQDVKYKADNKSSN